MEIGDEVLILDTASAVDYEDGPGWDREMETLIGTKGKIADLDIEEDLAYVTSIPLAFKVGISAISYGYWWKLRDLRVTPLKKWRRGACK